MEIPEKIANRYQALLTGLTRACLQVYKDRLVSLAIFGSVARGTYTPNSDLDLFLVLENLPRSRMKRAREFEAVEDALSKEFKILQNQGFAATLSPVFRTPEEAKIFSPLYLDMTEEVLILYDRDEFLHRRLDALRVQLRRLGAKRISKGSLWYWMLKPDLKPGEVFEL